MNLKMIAIAALVFAALGSLFTIYEIGFSAGEDAQKAILQDAINEQRKDYDTRLKARIKELKADYRESLLTFRAYEKERAEQAIARATAELEAEDNSNEITNRIQKIDTVSDCNSVDAMAYGVYRDSRRIVSDPRSTRINTSKDTATEH